MGGTDGKGRGHGSEEEDGEVGEELMAHASEKGTGRGESHGCEGCQRREMDRQWECGLGGKVLGELEVKKETEFCMRKDVSLATVTRAELTGPVLQLLFYKPVSRILSF